MLLELDKKSKILSAVSFAWW